MAVINGNKSPLELIEGLLTSKDTSTKYEVLSPTEKKALSGDASTDKGQTSEASVWELQHLGKAGQGDTFMWNDTTTGKVMNLPVMSKGVILKDAKSGEPLPATTLNEFLKTGNAPLLETNNIYFGNNKVSGSDLDKIVYDGRESARVYMPTNNDGSPNYEVLKQFKAAELEVNKHPDWSSVQINDFYQKRGLPYVRVDEKRSIIPSQNMRPFMIFYGFGAEGAESVESNGSIRLLEGGEKEEAKTISEKVWEDLKLDDQNAGWFDWSSDYFKGIIAIPYKASAAQYVVAQAGNGALYKKPVLEDMNAAQATQEARLVNGNRNFIKD